MSSTSPERSASALIQQGLAALRQGDREQAVQILGRAVRIDPTDEEVWLALAEAVAETERRRYCLERCLALNPSNERAQSALAALDGHQEPIASVAEPAPEAAAPSPAATEGDSPADIRAETEREPATPDATSPLPARLAAATRHEPATSGATSPLAARLAAAAARRESEPGAERRAKLEGIEQDQAAAVAALRAALTQGATEDRPATQATDAHEPPVPEGEPAQEERAAERREHTEAEPAKTSQAASRGRARGSSTPPLELKPMLLSEAAGEDAAPRPEEVAPRPEEVAEAALVQLLNHRARESDSRPSTLAATVAQRYFSTSRPKARASGTPEEALRALGMRSTREPVRKVQLVSLLVVLSAVMLLLFAALVSVGRITLV